MKNIKENKVLEALIAVLFVFMGVGLRLIPHPANFAPIGALALSAGVYFSRKTALILPLIAMVISDIFIGYYQIALMISVYGSFLLCVVLGFWLKKNKKWYTILGGSVLGAVLFFLITNFAVWAFTAWYPKTFSGLMECFVMALPFFKNTLLGSLFYSVIFFGTYEGIRALIRKKLTTTETDSLTM